MQKTIEIPLYKVRATLFAMIAGETAILITLIVEGAGVIIAAAIAGVCTLANTVLTVWLTGRQRDPPRKRRRRREQE